MTAGQPRTCSHLINTQTLTGVCQAVRMFSPWQFLVHVSIRTLKRDTYYLKVPHLEPNGH